MYKDKQSAFVKKKLASSYYTSFFLVWMDKEEKFEKRQEVGYELAIDMVQKIKNVSKKNHTPINS